MCLGVVSEQTEQKKVIRELEIREDGYVWLWKVFDLDIDDNLVAQFNEYDFYEGKNTARGKYAKYSNGEPCIEQYEPGFHCFDKEEDANRWIRNARSTNRERVIVPIQVKKSWITSTGWQSGKHVIVCKHIVI